MKKSLSIFLTVLLALVPFSMQAAAEETAGVTTLNYNQHRNVVTAYSNETEKGLFLFASYQDNALLSCQPVPAAFVQQACTVSVPSMAFGDTTKVFLWQDETSARPLCQNVELKTVGNTHSVVSNIYPWGSFDRAEQTGLIGTNHTEVAFDNTNQKTGSGCLKLTMLGSSGSSDVFWSAPLVKGETYDISFDYKKDAGNENTAAKLFLRHSNQETGKNTFLPVGTQVPTNDWQTYETTWTYTGEGNQTIYDNGYFYLRYGTTKDDPKQDGVVYIDNFCVKPHGDVAYDYTLLEDKLTWETNAQLIEPAKANASVMQNVYVDSENGNDGNSGSETAPFQTVYRARDYVRTINGDMTGDIKVYIRGEHYLPETLALENADSGTNGYHIEYTSWDTQTPATLSMGKDYTGFTLHDEAKQIYKVKVSDLTVDAATAPKINIDVTNTKDGKVYAINGTESSFPLTNDTRTRVNTNTSLTYEITVPKSGMYEFSCGFQTQAFNDANFVSFKMLKDGKEVVPLTQFPKAKTQWDETCDANNLQTYTCPTLIELAEGKNTITILNYHSNHAEMKALGFSGNGLQVPTKNSFTFTMKEGVGETTRQAYFNGKKGIRSRTVSGFDFAKVTTDTQNNVSGNPWLFDGTSYYHEIADETVLTSLKYPKEVDMRYVQKWTDFRAQIADISTDGENKTKVSLHKNFNGYIRYKINNQWVDETYDRYPIYFENAYEFLDAKGEWYLNPHDGYMYYIPRDGENMETMVLTIPKGEKLITVSGASSAKPVSHITFSNLHFTETAWNWPTEHGGHFSDQNYVSDWNLTGLANGLAKEIMPEGAIEVNNAWYVDFKNNDFSKLGAIRGLNMESSIHHCKIVGNEFYDLAGGAVSIGSVGGNNAAKRTVKLEDWEENNTISNNYIHDVSTDYMASAAVTLGIVRKTTVNHNEITNVPYSAIHVGWGWGGSVAKGTDMYDIELGYNRIEEHMNDRLYDGGGTYAVGCQNHEFASKKHSRIIGNYYSGQRNVYSSVYLDRGSQYWDCTENVVDQSDVLVQEKNFNGKYYYNQQLSYDRLEQLLGNSGVKQYGFLWGQASNNPDTINNLFRNNYSKNANVIDYYRDGGVTVENNTFLGYDGNYTDWNDTAKSIMANAGVEPAYRGNFDFTGAKYFVVRQKEYKMAQNATQKIDMKVKGRNDQEFDISDYNVAFYTDSDIVSIAPDGTVTANSAGEAWVMATAEVNGRTQTKPIHVIVE